MSQPRKPLYVLDADLTRVPRGPYECQTAFASPTSAAKVLAAFGEDACRGECIGDTPCSHGSH